MEQYRGTTILSVRRPNQVSLGGDGQVTLGNIVIKATARKIRRLYHSQVLAGFAGGTADAFTLFERFEEKLEKHQGHLLRSAVELAKDWRTDRMLRRLEAMLVVANKEHSLIITGNGDVLDPEYGIAAIMGAPIFLMLSKKIDPRILMSFAIGLSGGVLIAMSYMSTQPNLTYIIILVLLQGFGMIGVFVLLMPIAYIGVADNLSGDSSGVFNFARNFSMSIGTSIAATILSSQQQVAWGDLAKHISDYARGFHYWSQNLSGIYSTHNAQIMAYQIGKASLFQSYLDLYYLSGCIILAIMWMPFILKRPNSNIKPKMVH